MRRTALIAVALLASHGTALWLGRHSPAGRTAEAEAPASARKQAAADGGGLAAFLRHAKQQEEAGAEPEWDEPQTEDDLLAAAKAAIPADADVAAMVKAATLDPDLEISAATRAAFGLWADRDPVAALRWLTEWQRSAFHPYELKAEFIRHLHEAGLAKLGGYLRAVPRAGEFLIPEFTMTPAKTRYSRSGGQGGLFEPGEILQAAATLDSPGERYSLLRCCFRSMDQCTSNLARIRGMLDERNAAAFLGLIGGGPPSDGFLKELEDAGFPPYAIRQFVSDHSGWSQYGQTRTNADFIGTVANTEIPGVPAATGTNVTDIVTGGLRSGDGAITRNNIDAVLSNPNRTASGPLNEYGPITRNNIDAVLNNPNQTAPQAPTADLIRLAFRPSAGEMEPAFATAIELLPGYAESREDFLRGKLTEEEWITRLQGEIPGSADLHDELAVLAFQKTVGEDPRRALGFLHESQHYQDMMLDQVDLAPELAVELVNRLTGTGEMAEVLQLPLASQVVEWAQEDPGSYLNFLAELPSGPVKDFLQSLRAEDKGSVEAKVLEVEGQ